MSSPPLPAKAPATIAPGTILANKYRVERVLGQGGMGVVVEARHIALDERVALKFLVPEYASHPEASGRFLREARAAVKIKSEHVARVSDVGTLEGGEPYMVMEYLDGSDLSKLLEQRGPLGIEDAVDFIIQACEAIAEAHSYGIVHRDIKPANLFLTRHTDGAPLVKVLDFGISKVSGTQGIEALTRTTAAMGSALYMSPEQMQQSRSVDHRTDIYALGVALYELLAGKQPFFADTLPQLCAEILTGIPTPLRSARPDIPEPFAHLLERAYARDRNHRYQSVAEYVTALAPFAPARSQSSIDRICRMMGMNPPRAGAPQQFPAGPGQTVAMQPPRPGSNPRDSLNLIVPGHYEGPQSSGASAAFAGARTNMDLTSTGSGRQTGTAQPAGSKTPVIVGAIVAGMLVMGGAAALIALKGKPSDSASQAAETGSPVPPPTATQAAPPPEPAVTAAATAAPIDDPKPAPPATTGATATASAAAPPPPKPPAGKFVPPPPKKPATQPTTPSKPTAPPKGPNVFDDR